MIKKDGFKLKPTRDTNFIRKKYYLALEHSYCQHKSNTHLVGETGTPYVIMHILKMLLCYDKIYGRISSPLYAE